MRHTHISKSGFQSQGAALCTHNCMQSVRRTHIQMYTARHINPLTLTWALLTVCLLYGMLNCSHVLNFTARGLRSVQSTAGPHPPLFVLVIMFEYT